MLDYKIQLNLGKNISYNNFLEIKKENDFSNYQFQKETNQFFSPNLTDSTLNQIKDYSLDTLINDENSEFPSLIIGPNIKVIYSLEGFEEENIYNVKII